MKDGNQCTQIPCNKILGNYGETEIRFQRKSHEEEHFKFKLVSDDP